MRRLIGALLGSVAIATPAAAQWQVPNHTVPIGRGTGITGFNSAAPGTAGQVLTSTGTGTDPTFQTPTPITTAQGVPLSLCTGLTNQTTYVQAILNGGSKAVFVPPGITCGITGITIPANVSLTGSNAASIKRFGTSAATLITTGGNNASLFGIGTFTVDMNSDPLGNVSFSANGVSGIVIDGVNFINGTLHDIFLQDVTNYTVTNWTSTNNASVISSMISYHLAADSSNNTVSNFKCDRTAVASNCVYFVPQNGHTVSRLSIQNGRCIGPSGDVSGLEHSCIVLLGATTGVFPQISIKDIDSTNMNFPLSLVGSGPNGTVSGTSSRGGGTTGYGLEIALNTDTAYSNNSAEGNYTTGSPVIINTSTGVTWDGGAVKNTASSGTPVTFQVLEVGPGVGKRNSISSTTINAALGTALDISGNDTIVNGVLLFGNGTATNGINLNTGSNRTVLGVNAIGFTTPIVNPDTTDIICNNQPFGTVISQNCGAVALTSAHILVGNASNIATDVAMTGDVGITNAGVTTIANAAVSYAKIQNLGALSVMGRSANSAGVGANVSAVAASDSVLRESGSTIGFGTIATAGIANNAITLAKLATQATNTVLGNATAGAAVPTALAVPSCSTSASALQWTTNTGFVCNTSINAGTLNGATFAAPGAIGGGTPGTGAFTTVASGADTITSTSASALSVGRQGATNPVLQVDASAATVVSGLKITGAAAGGGVTLGAISLAGAEPLSLNALGSGVLNIGNISTGNINFGNAGITAMNLLASGFIDTFTFQEIIQSTAAFNASPFAGFYFQNKFNSAAAYAGMGGIGVGKENATDGDVAAYMSLSTRAAAASVAEKVRISSTGCVSIGTATDCGAGGVLANTFVQATSYLQAGTKIRAAGNAPALTSCGTSPAIVGSDLAGEVTMGTSTPTGCVITFNAAYVTAPLCTVTWQATPLASQSYVVSTTALTLTQTATSSNKANYTCMARSGG